jgi:hypothetical protein
MPDKAKTIETPFQRSQKYRIALAITGTATEHANQMDTIVFMSCVVQSNPWRSYHGA